MNFIFVAFLLSLLTACSAIEIRPRIVNGYKVKHGKSVFPYYAFLYLNGKSDKTAMCGASLISDRWVLTAAHCLWEHPQVIVLFGKTILNIKEKGSMAQTVFKNNFYIHHQYKDESFLYDIGELLFYFYIFFFPNNNNIIISIASFNSITAKTASFQVCLSCSFAFRLFFASVYRHHCDG